MENDIIDADAPEEVEVPEIFNYTEVLPRLRKFIGDWSAEIRETDRRRKMRKLDVDIDALRQEGKLKADENFIPIRVIDTNIKQEQPPFNSYLTQSRRLAIFEPLNIPKGSIDTQNLESDFTKLMTYVGWQEPFFDVVDGSQLHGWDWVEIEYDESRPGKVNINFLGHENVIIPLDTRDYQACEIIIVAYDFTILKLKKFIDEGHFDKVQGTRLLEKYKNHASRETETFKVYKKFCKYEDTVYVSWFVESECSDWLRSPEPLFMGRKRQEMVWKDVNVTLPDTMTGMPISIPQKQQVLDWVVITETIYPLKPLRYQKTEETELCETKGRAWLDGPKQEAQTCLWSNFVNGSGRASNIYASPEISDQTGAPARIEMELEPGSIYNKKMNFWSPPMPSMDLIRAAQALDTQTQVETGRVAFAAINNQDSRKTAQEIKAAQNQNSLLNSVQVTLFSIFLCEVWNHVWAILQSLALQGEIPLLTTGRDETTGKYINDERILSLDFKLMPSGDVDVIERAENEQKREKMWPLIQNLPMMLGNPLAIKFAKDHIEEMFPEDSAEYNAVIDSMVSAQQMTGALLNVIKVSAESKEPVTPQEYQQLATAVGASSGQANIKAPATQQSKQPATQPTQSQQTQPQAA